MSNIHRPIFIIGVGRSGSTIFHKVMTEHPDLYWLSERLVNAFPATPSPNNMLMRYIDYPMMNSLLKRRFYPGEAYGFWNYYYRGFSNPYRDLQAMDVTARAKRRIRSIFSMMHTPKKQRHLIKITGWNRIGFLYEIFPDALFIHVKRDPRAVINSFINVDFWSGWRGPQNWRMGQITEEQERELERFHHSFIALAGIKLELLDSALKKAVKQLPKDRFLEIKYEDFCEDTQAVLKKAIKFCQLPWHPTFEKRIAKYHIRNTNYKWKEDMTPEQQEIAEYFGKKLGY